MGTYFSFPIRNAQDELICPRIDYWQLAPVELLVLTHTRSKEIAACSLRVFEDKLTLSNPPPNKRPLLCAVRSSIADRARIIVATGTFPVGFLDALTGAENIDWQRVESFFFHLDE